MNDDLWESRIHLILANDGTYPDIFGCWGFMQELHYKGINIIDMLYISSGESYSYFNDRVGAIVYAGRFHYNPEFHPKVTDREGIALAATHEIGHALGLTRHWVRKAVGDKGVMDNLVNFKSDAQFYSNYNYFDIDHPDFPVGRLSGEWENPQMEGFNAMDTRKVVGIQTIDFRN